MLAIDRKSPVPLYYQVARILRDQILSGAIDPGSEIPSERELQENYNVSRHTIRQAFNLLVSEGLVRREQGRGSYILPEGVKVRSRIDTFFEHNAMLGEFGYKTTVRHIATEQCKPNDSIRMALGLSKEEEVLCFTKLFLANGKPAILAKDHIPLKVIKNPYDPEGAGHSFFPFVEDLVGKRIEYLISDIVPISASGEIADLLRCTEGAPLLLLQELFLDATQQVPLQFASNYHNPELIHFSILRKRRQP
jgi:GntR family transcriptional regulator